VGSADAEFLLAAGRKLAVAAMPYFRARVEGFVPRASADVARTAATKSGFFLYNPEEVAGRVAEQGGDVRAAAETCAWSWLHEALHLELRHHDRCGLRDPDLWNVAADVSVNQMLEGRPGVRRPPGRVMPADLGLPPDQTAEQYYALLAGRRPPPGCSDQCGSCATGRAGPGEPAADDPQAPSPARLRAVERGVAEAVRRASGARSSGVPRELAMWAEEQARPPAVDWRRELARLVRASVSAGAGSSAEARYDGPSRRQAGLGYGPGAPCLPRVRGREPRVAVGVDTSGSMHSLGPDVLGELDGVLRAVGAEVTLIACDARVRAVRRVRDLRSASAALVGGGGTDFGPLVAEACGLRPALDALLVLTDSYGPAPAEAPPCEVIWCLIGGATRPPAPWGRAVVVPK
jgi:predicted metal-dependent peptidase